jgi:hypothetical protein
MQEGQLTVFYTVLAQYIPAQNKLWCSMNPDLDRTATELRLPVLDLRTMRARIVNKNKRAKAWLLLDNVCGR